MAENPEVAMELRRVAKLVSASMPKIASADFVRGFDWAATALADAIGPCGCDPVPESPQNMASPPPAQAVHEDTVPESLRVPYRQPGDEWQDTAMKQLRTLDRQLAEIKRLKQEIERHKDALVESRTLLGETQARLERRIENQKETIGVLREANRQLYDFDLGRLVDHVKKLKAEAQTTSEVRAVQEIGALFATPPMTDAMVDRLRNVRCANAAPNPNPGSWQDDIAALKKAREEVRHSE